MREFKVGDTVETDSFSGSCKIVRLISHGIVTLQLPAGERGWSKASLGGGIYWNMAVHNLTLIHTNNVVGGCLIEDDLVTNKEREYVKL